MTDLFADKAADFDQRPVPAQISAGVGRALLAALPLDPTMSVLDFGAGTGLLCAHVAPHVAKVIAVDISPAMLAQLQAKPELAGRVETRCQDLRVDPLGAPVDAVVSAMALHHIEDPAALFTTLYAHLVPGGRLALADLDAEDGSFHPPGTPGVFHAGFDREVLRASLTAAGFAGVHFETACTVHRDERPYPIFLVTAQRPQA